MNTTNDNPMVALIAKQHLGLDTLDIRNSDSLDFKEHSVWQIKAALDAAFKAGRLSS